jgi:hypothetical protein
MCMHVPVHCRCALFAVIAAAPAFVVERRTALQEMLNGAYGGHMFCFGEHHMCTRDSLICAVLGRTDRNVKPSLCACVQ